MYFFYSCLHIGFLFVLGLVIFFFFKQNTAYEMRISDGGSDVCSSDLTVVSVEADVSEGSPVVPSATVVDVVSSSPEDSTSSPSSISPSGMACPPSAAPRASSSL